ncbi:MAG: hypothetical protein AAGA93_08715 [Actinomycetota bacterium]
MSTTDVSPDPDDTSTGQESTSEVETEPSARPGLDACRPGDIESAGRVERSDLVETSGLAASRRHEGVLWAHNDSGSAAGIYAVGLDGEDLGFFALQDDGAPVDAVDVEDVAIVDDRLYLADIGDNGAGRAAVTVYVLAEPEPGVDGQAEVLQIIQVRYPDGPTDAEALVVDPASAELLILSKDLDAPTAPTRLYAAPLPDQTTPLVEVEPTLVGQLDVAAITATSASISIGGLLFPGSVTGADLAPAGDLLVLRTYGSAWLFARADGQSLAEALAGEPCEGGAAGEGQGEAIAFLPPSADGLGDGAVRYATIGEGANRAVNVVVIGGG